MSLKEERRAFAMKAYHGDKNYNSAQAVVAGAYHPDAPDEELVLEMAAYGKGAACNGVCGALYAAMTIAQQEDQAQVQSDFEFRVSYSKCEDILESTETQCIDCVGIAIDCLEKFL